MGIYFAFHAHMVCNTALFAHCLASTELAVCQIYRDMTMRISWALPAHKIASLFSLFCLVWSLLITQPFAIFQNCKRTMVSLPFDPALLAKIPALQPPDGVTSNFVDPESRAGIFRAVAYTSLSIMMVFLLLRIYTRAVVNRTFGADDCKCPICSACSSPERLLIS